MRYLMHCLAVSKSVHNFMSDFLVTLAPLSLRQNYMS